MPNNIRVRMYRPGFGDCFLITFGSDPHEKHVLIDFGAHMHGEIGTLDAIMDDIEATTGNKLALIVSSHAHRDHIHGFGKFADRFAGFDITEVWMPWTDDKTNKKAAALQKKHFALYDKLDTHLRFALKAPQSNQRYAAALNALSNLRGNDKAMTELRRGFGTGAKRRYLAAGKSIPKVAGVPGLSAEILSPPNSTEFFSRMDPPADQRFLTAPGDVTADVRPFRNYEIRKGERDYRAVIKDGQPLVPPGDLKALHEFAEAPADRLALALDNVRNNTSLVILFRYQGKTLLFPGDAQWGNWQSWIGTDVARQLIGEIDFLKIAHHGSHNATPVSVVKALKKKGLTAMCSTQGHPYPTIPRMPLLDELEKRGWVARSDWIKVKGAKDNLPLPAKLPKGVTANPLSLDYTF